MRVIKGRKKQMSEKATKTPQIRFDGYTDAWEERKLIDLATTYIGLVTTMTENYTNKGTLLIRNSDIKEGRFDLSNPIYLEEQFAEENKTRRMRKGDVVTVHTGDIGTSAMINSELDGAIGFATITTRPTKELDSNFLAWYFNSNYHKKYAKRMSTGDGRSNYNMKDFNKNVIPTPQIDEQQKIGSFFKQLDETIALHQRECDLLAKMKKSYLQKMFPKNGEDKPEIRFDGYTDAWEQRKLSELYNKNTEKNEELISYDKTISIATMTYKNGGNGASDKSLKAYKVLRVGDLAFEGHTNKKFKYGRFVLNDIGTGIMSPRFSTLRPIQCMPISFWKYYIHYEPIMQKILVNSTKAGTMMNELVIPEFLKQSILVPSMNEQQKIGEYFSNLDRLITLHQRELDSLKKMKKSLLQMMFV